MAHLLRCAGIVDMKVLAILLVYIVVQANGNCLNLEECMQNVTNTFLGFGEYYSRVMFDAKNYIKFSVPKFKTHFKAFNEAVLSGPKECRRKHLLKQEMGYYLRDAMNLCEVPHPDPNPEDVKNIRDINLNNGGSTKERYCNHLVPYFNIYCKYLDDVMETADNCDVVENFDLLFTSKWLACKNKELRIKDKA